ncbi:MAG TPA: LuxR C-terminal-related transcriptional regulator [Acidimicrobiales bacterium]|jgi:DNA-binding CsgD family transcriptional regulator|nr:LuxR C-terminal-related transcriptional regulator [Acidimicrobiales bacterium]
MAQRAGALEQEAEARYRAVDYPGAIDRYEEAFRAYREAGDRLGAGRAARIVAWLHGNVHGDWAVAGGWFGRARALLEDAGPDSAEHGWVLLMQVAPDGDPTVQEARCRQALELGRRHGDPDLEFEAQGWVALTLIQSGRVEEGLLLFDEVLAALCAGEIRDVFVVEGTICGMFLACERANDVVRAEQWLRVTEDVVGRPYMAGVSAFCRAHYGGILTAAGRWSEAEVELTEAARLLDRTYVGMRGTALVRLADLRARQGRLEEAEELLAGFDQRPDAFRPLAAVHFARGNTALARDLLERALAQDDMVAVAGPVLALLVDVELADGAVADARRAAQSLADLAVRQGGHYLRAAAALARGKVCVAEGTSDARACLREALSSFAEARMPVHLAQARLELARALAAERPEVALAEASAALEAFERLQAARDADAAAAVVRSLGGPARTGPKRRQPLTRREEEVLDLLGHGLTNPEIGERLYISRKTVEHHVGRVLAKLGLRSRAEAAAHAARTGRRPGRE